jgi:hypothetical protein
MDPGRSIVPLCRMIPWVVRRLPDASAFLVRDAVPKVFLREALLTAQALPSGAWLPIHSKTGEDVHRVVLMASDAHAGQLEDEGEEASITTDSASIAAGCAFRGYAAKAAAACGLPVDPVVEVEFVRVLSRALGQHEHMDTYYQAWGYVLCLHDDVPPTNLLRYTYHGFPKNMEPGNVRRGWGDIPTEGWAWRQGDILVMRLNRIHNGPANPGDIDRYIIFGSSAITGVPGVYSDTSVIFQDTFFGVDLSPNHSRHTCYAHSLSVSMAIYLHVQEAKSSATDTLAEQAKRLAMVPPPVISQPLCYLFYVAGSRNL